MSIQDIARPGTDRRTPADSLRGLCGGAVHLPGDPGFDGARAAWNLSVDQRPAAVAYPATAAETAELVRTAAAAGLRLAPQSTGHNAGPLGRLDDVVIVRTSAMTQISVDPARRIAGSAAGWSGSPWWRQQRRRAAQRCTARRPMSALPDIRWAAE